LSFPGVLSALGSYLFL
jgi:hypothetical protein